MSRIIELKNTEGDYKQLEVEVSYTKGGMNYFTSSVIERGIKITFTPCNISYTKEGYKMYSYTAIGGKGFSYHIKTLKRKSVKQIKEVEEYVYAFSDDDLLDMYYDKNHRGVFRIQDYFNS